jgi:cytochrome P450
MASRAVSAAVEFDPYSEDFWNGAYDTFRRLRDEAPVYRNDRRDFFALSRYEDVHEALRDHGTYSSASGVILNQLTTPGFNSQRDFPGFVIGTDPPLHTQLRGLVSRSFSARAVADLEEAVRRSVRHHMDRIEEAPSFDLCADFADRVPADVMYDLMGVPEEDRARVFGYNEDFNDVGDATAEANPPSERHLSGQLNMVQYVIELAERKRAEPKDDLISEIIQKTIDRPGGPSGPLEPMELGGFLLTLLGAGVETTTKMLANIVVAFHRHPAEWQKVLDDPAKIPAAVEEIGRYQPPIHLMGRRTTREVVLHDVTIPEGSNVLLLLGAANRDERVFPDPDAFDIDRVVARAPVTFGFGIHLCVGAALARQEVRVAVEEIRNRWPKFTIDEANLKMARNYNTVGFTSVPMRID